MFRQRGMGEGGTRFASRTKTRRDRVEKKPSSSSASKGVAPVLRKDSMGTTVPGGGVGVAGGGAGNEGG